MPSFFNKQNRHDGQSVFSSSAFHLIYLLFYFVPWLISPPSYIDVFVALVAIAIFIPLYLRTNFLSGAYNLPQVFITEALAVVATLWFHGSGGTFHIFSTALAASPRDIRKSLLIFALVSIIWSAALYFSGRHLFEWSLTLFISAIVMLSTRGGIHIQLENDTMCKLRSLDKQSAALAERERISRDLHDVLGHTLTMVALKLEVTKKFIQLDPQRAERELEEVRQATRNALSDMRKTVSCMVEITLETEIQQAQIALQDASIAFEIIGSIPNLPNHASNELGLIVRESITNIIRHSNATRVVLELVQAGNELSMTIKDDGIGVSNKNEGAGLNGLRRRVENLGGKICIGSPSGIESSEAIIGTRVCVQLPFYLSDTEH